MTQVRDRSIARRIAYECLGRGDALGWFEKLYTEADNDASIIPWADLVPNPSVTSWMECKKVYGRGKRALKVGCGLGDDAEFLSQKGFDVTAFDISPRAIDWCQTRFPESEVNYMVANLFNAPADWTGRFDFVLESYTLQVFLPDLRRKATQIIASFVAPRGALLAVSRARDTEEDPGKMPWPLTRREIGLFKEYDLVEVLFEDYTDSENPPVRRFRVEYRK